MIPDVTSISLSTFGEFQTGPRTAQISCSCLETHVVQTQSKSLGMRSDGIRSDVGGQVHQRQCIVVRIREPKKRMTWFNLTVCLVQDLRGVLELDRVQIQIQWTVRYRENLIIRNYQTPCCRWLASCPCAWRSRGHPGSTPASHYYPVRSRYPS